MLVLSPLRSSNAEEREAVEGFSDAFLGDDFLDSIDFSGIFEGFGVEGNLLPELEVTESHDNILPVFSAGGEQEQVSEESIEELTCVTMPPARMPENRRATAKGSHGKKKVKVDWTPELHRRFVQAVEQLGVDKAVPSRILGIMGIQNLTRHNVASHLQKYRCQRKHLLAREVEAASWSQRQQIYAFRAGDGNAKGIIKNENNPWIPPTIGFRPPPSLQPQFRPLHVWGHPTVDSPPMVQGMWPGHPLPLHSPPPPWPSQPPNYYAYWQRHYQGGSKEGWGPNAVISNPPFVPQPLPAMRFAPPTVAGVPPHPMYIPQIWAPPLKKHPSLQPEHSAHPSEKSVDGAIGDVLAKPWLPLPLGLKPPSTESVMVELQRQGVSKVQLGCNLKQTN